MFAGRVGIACWIIAVCSWPGTARAMWVGPRPERVPVARLITNTERYLENHPNDPNAYYVLGRLHSFAAFEVQALSLAGPHGRFRIPDLDDEWFVYRAQGQIEFDTPAAIRSELGIALKYLLVARRLAPADPFIVLSMGWVYEARWQADLVPEDADRALRFYREVIALCRGRPMKWTINPAPPEVDEEAVNAIIRLETALHRSGDQAELREMKALSSRLEGRRLGITPIVLSLTGGRSLAPLLSDSTAHFDLDGMGPDHTWPWLTVNAGILAWDPDHCDQIRDGTQLFGSVTWWMFWRDGYGPLEALDDNGDGVLTGAELEGLVIWVDGNGNGVSEPGEVSDARAAGIRSIAARAQGRRDGVLWNPAGAELDNGEHWPSFDWTPERLENRGSVRATAQTNEVPQDRG